LLIGLFTLWLSPWLVRHISIHVHKYDVHASLNGAVLGVTIPRPISRQRSTHVRQNEAAPLTARRQAAAALPRELIDERCLSSIFVAKDIGADFTVVSTILAGDLLPFENGSMK